MRIFVGMIGFEAQLWLRHCLEGGILEDPAVDYLAGRVEEMDAAALLEAMSTGIPVVATSCVPQSLRIDGGCMIVPIDDTEALSEAMGKVMDQTDFDGRKVSEAVSQVASPAVIGEKLTELFNGLRASD